METPINDIDEYAIAVQLILGWHIEKARRNEEQSEFDERFRWNRIAEKLIEVSTQIAEIEIANPKNDGN